MLQHSIKKYLDKFIKGGYDAMILLKEVEDPKRFGVAEFDEKGRLVRLVEKPKEPPSKYALVGVYFFTPVIFDVIRDLKPSWRGEYEITDAIQMLMDRGFNVGYDFVEGWWVDTGKKDYILSVNALILDERAKREIRGKVENSKVEGRVEVGDGTYIKDSTIRGPAVIGRNCLIERSYISPYVSVGDNSHIINSSVEYSVILEGVTINGIERLEESLIGRYAKITKGLDNRKSLKLHVGDHSEVVL